MLRCYCNTQDLIDRHNDLMLAAWEDTAWQRGSSGTVAGTELPATFTSEDSSLRLNHWLSDAEDEIPLASESHWYLPVLNVPGSGFFRVTSITDNKTATINWVSEAHRKTIARFTTIDLDEVTVDETTGGWSLGGWEEKIARAYVVALSDLRTKNVNVYSMDDDDATYEEAIASKALELVYTSLVVTPGDTNDVLSQRYRERYNQIILSVTPVSSDIPATMEFTRNG